MVSDMMDHISAIDHGDIDPSPAFAEEVVPSPYSEKSQPDTLSNNLGIVGNAFPSPPELLTQPTPALEASPDIFIATLTSAALPPITTLNSFKRPSLANLPSHNMRLPNVDPFGAISPRVLVGRSTITDIDSPGGGRYPDPFILQPVYHDSKPSETLPDLEPNPSIMPIESPMRQYVFVQTPSREMPENVLAGDKMAQPGYFIQSESSEEHKPTSNAIQAESETIPTFQIPLEKSWLYDLAPVILSARQAAFGNESPSQIRVLTHALPSPSKGHAGIEILTKVLEALTPEKSTWVSHWHAVSGRFDMEDIPTSPPSTPAAPGEGVDYFTTRVFDSAVSVPDYQHQSALSNSAAQRSIPLGPEPSTMPRPAVTPASVDISITERYIPPASSSEFINLTDPLSGRSLISDRFVELSEDCGLLIFVYPTANGGKTFLREYLGILDPTLRSMMVSGAITAEDCERVGLMKSVEGLFSFEELKSRLNEFCRRVSQLDSTSNLFHRFPSMSGVPLKYEVIHASKRTIDLAPDVWTDWWIRQEKERIKKALALSRRTANSNNRERSESNISSSVTSHPSSESISLTHAREIFESLERLAMVKKPDKGIEVGVFIVKKEKKPNKEE